MKFFILFALCVLFLTIWQCRKSLFLFEPTTIDDSSEGEKRCRQWLQSYFNKPFIKVRPDWLKNPIFGRNLELDCYNESLKLAVEYNGQQHYSFVPKFHVKGYRDLKYSKYKDHLKKKLCEEHGVYLIVVPYYEHVETYLANKIKEWEVFGRVNLAAQ